MTVRTRFAPSPTGYMHIGNVRTALFSWLYARKMQGKFILRVEDTDLERSSEDCVRVILEAMEWLGLDYDEGPYYQTDRFDRYQAVINQLLEEGKAYRCYCSKERLDHLRECQLMNKNKPRYDSLCRDIDEVRDDCPYIIRFKNPTDGVVAFEDIVHGKLTFQNSELDDLVIARGDGSPTYNFTVVVDDLDMNVTHVIRGDDHINNTPRQINILKALGAEPPKYAHVPMILGDDGKRLSKRHGAVATLDYREQGFLPQALLNYLVRLGWSHGDQEIFSRDEMIKYFDLTDVNKAPSAFNTKKLLWLNQHYLKAMPAEEVAEYLQYQMEVQQLDMTQGPPLTDIVKVQAERTETLKEMAEKSRYFYEEPDSYDEKAIKKHFKENTSQILNHLLESFSAVSEWKADILHQIIVDAGEKFDVKLGKIAQPLRIALTGSTISPPIDVTLMLIGQERVLNRIQQFISIVHGVE